MKLRNKILLPVLLILAVAVFGISAGNYFIARQTVTGMIDLEMDTALNNILAAHQLSAEISDIVLRELDSKNIALARALAEIIRLDNEMLETEEMVRIAALLDVTEVHVADGDGILLWGNVPGFFGFDFDSGEQSRPFMEILRNPAFELAQEAQPNETLGVMFSYTGVARTDEPGFVQVGIAADVLNNLFAALDVQRTIEATRIGEHGFLFVVEDGVYTAHPDGARIAQSFAPSAVREAGSRRQWLTVDGVEFYAGYLQFGNTVIYSVMPAYEFFAGINQLGLTSVGFSLLAIFLMSAIMFVILTHVTSPLGRLTALVTDVRNGRLSVNKSKDADARDEFGQLTRDMHSLIDVIRDMTDDFAKFNHETNTVGDIEYRMDAAKYQGSYREMILSLNDFTDKFVEDMLVLIGVMDSIGHGDFNVAVKQFPGKKIIMNQRADSLMANLRSVSAEISAMIDAAANRGDLNFKIDESNYEGDWRGIMAGLNGIAEAVHAPLQVVSICMREMAAGRFDINYHIEKCGAAGYDHSAESYAGTFRQIIEDFDSALTTTASYIGIISADLKAIAGGDLTTELTQNFVGDYQEIKESLNTISRSMRKTMTEINAASMQVLSGAKQISASSADLAAGASTQANSVQELNASVDIINEQTLYNADSAGKANTLSQESTENAREGNAAMQQTLRAMAQIKEDSGNISKIIKTIQDIAFQTNLLALNAAVEAARAGEHGKGFAVVAEEVRNLAARSQAAASETTQLIGHSVSSVETGSEIAQATAETLNTIVENANTVQGIVSEISDASQGQATAISQVVQGLHQISEVVQSNSAVSEEAAAASQELTAQAEVLQQLVSTFKI